MGSAPVRMRCIYPGAMPPSDRSEHARGVPARSPRVTERPGEREAPALALGRLPDGTPYFAPLGEIAYDPDEDRVQCHRCGCWYRGIAGSHLHRVHGWTIDEYREAFRLMKGVPTVAVGVSTALAAHTRRRVQAGELPADFTPEWRARRGTAGRYRVQRWRSLAVLRPDLAAELHPTPNGDLDPYAVALHSRRVVWWRCPGCSWEWRASIQGRARGQGRCPGCRRPAEEGGREHRNN
jgi:hypothetical protein